MIIADACVLIAFLDSADAQHHRALRVMRATAGHQRGASLITIAEVLVGPARSGQLAKAQDSLRVLKVDQVALRTDAPERLAQLRAGTGLKIPDCSVLLAAQDSSADTIATFDDRLATAARELAFDVLS